MRRINLFKILIFTQVLLFSSPSFAQDNENKTPKQIAALVQSHIDGIIKESDYTEKHKKLSILLDMVNKEFRAYSNTVTEYKSKILKNPTIANVKLIQEKDINESVYNSWIVYKIALEPNYSLFIEKKNKYHCDEIADEIWQNYAPTAPNTEKIKLDSYTKKAVEASIELAENLCKTMPL